MAGATKTQDMNSKLGERISYDWIRDFLFTLSLVLLALITSHISSKIFDFKVHEDFFIGMYYFAVFLSLIIGLRPVLGLRIIPNTLHISRDGCITIDRKIRIRVSDIKTVYIKDIGLAESNMHYYEICLESLPIELEKRLKNRSSIVCAERYFIKNLMGTKTLLSQALVKHGLERNRIKRVNQSTSNMFGTRDKFIK